MLMMMRVIMMMMHRDNISSVYTSGRKCNFQDKGCDAEHLQPININGWFWADGRYKSDDDDDDESDDDDDMVDGRW